MRQLAAEKLHVEVAESDIIRFHRVGKRSANIKTRDIIVNFTTHVRKIDIMKNGKLLKGTNIFINEDLTKTRATLACMEIKNPQA